MNQLFKTISFPKEKSETNKTEIIRLAFNRSTDLDLFDAIKPLRSSEIRSLLPNLSYKKLTETADKERRSLNQLCLFLLSRKIDEIKKSYGDDISLANALSKNLVYTSINKKSATFHDNKVNEIHRWYPYIEGFSCTFVDQIIDNLPYRPTLIYDPFSGSGTTQLVASHRNIPSAFSEINPFMILIINCKISKTIQFISKLGINETRLLDFIDFLSGNFNKKTSLEKEYKEYIIRLGSVQYFQKATLINLLKIKELITKFFKNNSLLKDLSLFALSTIIVGVSNTIRRADLRYRRENEKRCSPSDVLPFFCNKINEIISDIEAIKKYPLCETDFVSYDAKNIPQEYNQKFDLVITSPPYVNGTNYFRNTKLELVLLDLVNNVTDISNLKKEAITSGINNVVRKNREIIRNNLLNPIIKRLNKCAYDQRIPVLVESYFSDMHEVFASISKHLEPEAHFYLDIGDSQFAGVHIPADKILIDIARQNNLELVDNKFIRERFSKNGMPLKQVLLLFKKGRNKEIFHINTSKHSNSTKDLLLRNISFFKNSLPYKEPPYNSRNWGHNLHSLCSYQGKLKPSLAHFIVKLFSSEGMTVLDPLCGVGTIPLEACLQGRMGIGNDLSLLAYVNTLAKVNNPEYKRTFHELDKLHKHIDKNLISSKEARNINFGYNRNITEYYHLDTFREILTAREYFKKMKSFNAEKALLLSAVLHVLHGNRPYALSRRSHNVTPLAPRGPFEHKSLIEKTHEKVKRTLNLSRPESFQPGMALNQDYKLLNGFLKDNSIDLVATSPPFFDSTRFYMSNWIRMWFCGWDKIDFETRKKEFLETEQVRDMNVYIQFFEICKKLLKENGVVIMHLGKSRKHDMGKTLSQIASEYFEVFDLFDENVSHCEKFGIRDQGSTKAHQFLFLIS